MKVKLLGEPAIVDDNGQARTVRGYQAWALLARVILARGRLDRRNLSVELFPETVDPLGSLRWCLASLRSALDCSECLKGDPIEGGFPPGIEVDLWQFEEPNFDLEDAGPLLGSIVPRCSAEFSTWLLVERERIAGLVEARIKQDAIRLLAIGDHQSAVRLAELGARRNPFDESAHVLLVKSLSLAGRYDAALEHVEATEALFLAELGKKPSPALRSAARRDILSPPGGISPKTFINSLMQSGLAALSAGAADAGIDCLRRAVHEAGKANDTQLLAKATFQLGKALVHAVRGYDDEGSVLLRQSAELARQCGSSAVASASFRELGYIEALAGRRPAAAMYLSNAIDLATETDNLAGIHGVMGFNLVDWGRIDEGLDNYAISLGYARAAGNRRREIWSLGLGAWGLVAANRLEQADEWLHDCLKLVEEQRWIAFRPWPVAVLNESRLRQGIHAMTLRPHLEETFALSCQLGDPCWEAVIARVLALTYAATNDFDQAARWLIDARRRCVRNTDAYAALEVEIVASQAEISLRQNNISLADKTAREWVSLAARFQMNGHIARAADFIAAR